MISWSWTLSQPTVIQILFIAECVCWTGIPPELSPIPRQRWNANPTAMRQGKDGEGEKIVGPSQRCGILALCTPDKGPRTTTKDRYSESRLVSRSKLNTVCKIEKDRWGAVFVSKEREREREKIIIYWFSYDLQNNQINWSDPKTRPHSAKAQFRPSQNDFVSSFPLVSPITLITN